MSFPPTPDRQVQPLWRTYVHVGNMSDSVVSVSVMQLVVYTANAQNTAEQASKPSWTVTVQAVTDKQELQNYFK